MVSRFEDFQKTSLDLNNKISKQFSELMAAINRLRDDKLGDDRSTLDRYSPESQKVKGSGSGGLERSHGDRRTEESPEDQALNDEELVETEVETKASGIEDRFMKPIYEIKADKEIPKASSMSKRRYKLQKKISCEEMDERMLKGLCVFCNELETPDHYLQHMNSSLLMIDSEDHLSDSMVNEIGNEISSDSWLSNSIGCELETGETDNYEDRAVENEANTKMISAMVKEESIPRFQVPVSDLEHGLRIHNASSIVCEDSQYVVGCDELRDHQKSILQVSYVKEVEELSQKSTSGICENVAHQLFDQKPVRVTHKEKHMKHLKAWKFKFKPTSKKSKLVDDMLSFMEETSLLNKDPKEISWDRVKKEFKETMDACGKTRVDRFKLVEEKESRPEVLNLNQTCLYHQIGHGVDILLAFKMLDHDKERAVALQRSTSLTIRDCPGRSSRANRVWKPGGLLCVQDHRGGSTLMITQHFQGLQLQRIIYMDMKFQEVLIDDVSSVMVCVRMDETSDDLLLLNGKENEGCLNGSQALVLMKGITESSSRIEELMKEEPDFVKVNASDGSLKQINIYEYRWIQEVFAVIGFLVRRHLQLAFNCEEPELAERKRNHGLFIRLHSKQKQRKCPKTWMYKFKMDSEPAGTSYLKRHKEYGICAQIRGAKKQSKLLLLSLCPSFICRAMLRVTVKQRKHSKTWSFKYKQQGNFRLLRCVGERTGKDIVTVTSCRSYGLGKKFLLLNLEVKVSLKGEDVIQERRIRIS